MLGFALAAFLVLAAEPSPAAAPVVAATGTQWGIEPLSLGGSEIVAAGGATGAVSAVTALTVGPGSSWVAFRMPLALDGALHFAQLSVSPGVVLRAPSGTFRPYVGGGIRLNAMVVHRSLLGLSLVAPASRFVPLTSAFDEHHSSGHSDPNDVSKAGAGGELWGGIAWQPSRWFGLSLDLDYAYERIAGVGVSAVRESLGVALAI